MADISVIDVATRSGNEDTLGTGIYAEALSEFIQQCETPLTIGIQGEWGSGKTSLLNLIKEYIENQERKHYSNVIKGSEEYKVIEINTWEHSLLKSPEETLISILSEIADKISKTSGVLESGQKTKKYLGSIAKGALRIGAAAALGDKGAQVTEELLGESDNSVKQLRNTLQETVDTIINSDTTPIKKFIIFVDDLDRLNPADAIQILELLKNIFSITGCVFVLAIDYQVVVKGLKHKFGEMTEENEWEFRAFFDKIIQMPFMMPMSSYKMDNYIQKLLTGVGYFKVADFKTVTYLTKTIQVTIGNNPRALKRLVNSLSLINLHWQMSGNKRPKGFSEGDDYLLKSVMLVLVCIQISFPKIFELLSREPDFSSWNEDLVSRLTKGEHEDDKELNKAYNHAVHNEDPDFDEEWEQSLFKIVWFNKWQRNRLPDISRVLSVIKDDVLPERLQEKIRDVMEFSIKATAVTSIVSTFEESKSSENDDASSRKSRIEFWNKIKADLAGAGSDFGTNMKQNILSSEVKQKCKVLNEAEFIISWRASNYIKFQTTAGDDTNNLEIFKYMQTHRHSIEDSIGAKLQFKLKDDDVRQELRVKTGGELPNRGEMPRENKDIQDLYSKSVADILPKFISAIESLIEQYEDLDQEVNNIADNLA